FLAVRCECFGDLTAAVEQYERLRKKFNGDADNRLWFLLTATKAEALKPEADKLKTADRKLLANKWLDTAEGITILPQMKERRATWMDVIALYENKTAFRDEVDRARKLLPKP